MKRATLPYWLHAFFHEWLAQQRNLSHHTVKSYRDTWRLFLRFVAGRKRRSVSDLVVEDLTAEEVLAFLQHGEQDRKITIGTRNCRLAALRGFFRFVAEREPSAVAQCAEVLHHPDEEGADGGSQLPRYGGDYGDLEAAGSVHSRRAARSRTACVALQHWSANPGGAGSVSAIHPLPLARTSDPVRKRSEGENLPTVAGNSGSPHGVAQATAETR